MIIDVRKGATQKIDFGNNTFITFVGGVTVCVEKNGEVIYGCKLEASDFYPSSGPVMLPQLAGDKTFVVKEGIVVDIKDN